MQCGGHHSVIQMNDGRWFVFGYNSDGRLGIGNTQNHETPIELPSPVVDNENNIKDNRFINIFCGDFHNIGITENGDCYGWGRNEKGQLGLDNCANYSTPTRLKEAPFSTLNQVQQKQRYIWFSCGSYHTVALTNLGIVVFWYQQLLIQFNLWFKHPIIGEWFVWGSNNYGQLGIESISRKTVEPQRIIIQNNDENEYIQFITARDYNNIAITKNDGNKSKQQNIYCWGMNFEGSLGVGHNKTVPIPTKIENLPSTAVQCYPSIHYLFSSLFNKNWELLKFLIEDNLYSTISDGKFDCFY